MREPMPVRGIGCYAAAIRLSRKSDQRPVDTKDSMVSSGMGAKCLVLPVSRGR